MSELRVTDWIPYKDSDGMPENPFGGIGGWFRDGNRWQTYLDACDESIHPYAEALRSAVLEMKLKEGGDWHQSDFDAGVPVFSDGTISTFSYRAWGDFMAAVWSTEEDKDYSYMSFYMSAW